MCMYISVYIKSIIYHHSSQLMTAGDVQSIRYRIITIHEMVYPFSTISKIQCYRGFGNLVTWKLAPINKNYLGEMQTELSREIPGCRFMICWVQQGHYRTSPRTCPVIEIIQVQIWYMYVTHLYLHVASSNQQYISQSQVLHDPKRYVDKWDSL